ncbi:MAG: hypothetical protein J6F30_08295, partial [Cellulosilyticum sp.]|nr:hypothetical protein [Cellulosilyticum sp.]
MKIKKSIWIASIIILLSLFGGLYYYTQGQSLEYSKLMNQIEKRTYHQVEIEQVLYESVMERIEHKLNQGEEILPIEQFFLGYDAYYSGDHQKAYDYYMPISRIGIPNNDNLANVLMNAQLNKICAATGKGEEGIELTYYWFDYYEENVMERHIEIIHTLIGQLLNAENGANVAIDLCERVIAHKASESYPLLSFMKQFLQSLYADKGDYGRALEIGMEELAKAEIEGNHEIIASQRYGVGSIYGQMHNHEYAKDWFAQCFKIPVDGSDKIAYFKVMSAINYISCAVMLEEFEGIEEATRVYKENLKFIEERYIASSEANFALVLANYYTTVGDLSAAVEKLEFAAHTQDIENSGEAYRMDFLSIAGPCYMALGEYEKAIQALEEVVHKDYVMKAEAAAQMLIDYYIQIGDTTNIKKYTDKLQELKSKVQKGINTSYADYAAHKYQYEVKLREMNKKEIRSYVVFLCSIMLAIS